MGVSAKSGSGYALGGTGAGPPPVVPPVLVAALIRAHLQSISPEVADTITLTWQLLDFNGFPILSVRLVELFVYETSTAGETAMAANGSFTAVSTGTLVAGLNTNRVTVSSSAAGLITVDVTDVVAETVYVTVVTSRGPLPVPTVVVQSDEAVLVFA